MDSLQYLVNKRLIGVDLKPIKPLKPITVVHNGVIFQNQCHNGLNYDIAISWLQKAIRRGLCEEALYCAYHIAELGKIFRSHLLNRLIVILSEDIGPAEPELAQVIERLYVKAKRLEQENSLSEMHTVIVEMVYLLTYARKSRITDWLIHSTDKRAEVKDEYDSVDAAVAWASFHCHERTHSSTVLNYTYDKVEHTMYKNMIIYDMWNALLDICPVHHYDEIVALLKLFMIRGCEYGVLHIVHAITLCFFDTVTSDLKVPDKLPTWSDIGSYSFVIMNDAVDMHTRYGRTHLGRSMIDFMKYGSKLVNWTPFPNEQAIIDRITDNIEKIEVEDSIPRQYQQTIVDKTIATLKAESRGWLLMACGTGKTKTSYWCMNDLVDDGVKLIVIVTPFLQILRQFYSCWAAMNRMNKRSVMSGILASCTDSFMKDQYTNYEYIDSVDKFITYPDKIKVIYTTYASLVKLIDTGIKPDLTIYDEAHHLQHHKMFNCGYELFLTATPHKYMHSFGNVIASYNMRDAINDGHLTPYNIYIMQEPDFCECMNYIMENNKKTIVYCGTNGEAYALYSEWIEENGSDNAFYVNCKTPKKEREVMFNSYKKLSNAVIFNCAILGEGVDFTDCDSILICSGYVSPTRVVQAVGRPLRLSKGKTVANIYMMDDKNVEKRLKGLSLYDTKVAEIVSYIR
jgi:superfamily II DNA or RNA helicase